MYRFHLGNQNLRRILALTLACLMIFTSLPAGAFRVFAEDEQTEGDAIVETFEETEAGEEDPAPEVPEGDLEEGEGSETGRGSVVGELADEIGNILNKDNGSNEDGDVDENADAELVTLEELQEADGSPRAVLPTRDITVTIEWEGDIPEGFTYPDSVGLTVESSADGETWTPVEGSFTVEPDDWTATFSLLSADETGASLSYRVKENRAGLERFLRTPASVTIGPDDSGDVTFTNTYNDAWDYTIDLYWSRTADERTHVNTVTTLADGDALVYKLDIRTQKMYEGIPTTVSDEELLNPTSGIVIRIPLHLFKDRNNQWVDPSGYSIADDSAPTVDREFTYRIIGDEIVFYNYRTLPSSYTASYTVGYTVIPAETWDGSTAQLQANATGHYNGQPADDPGTQTTAPITYRIDTGSYISQFSKDAGISLYHASGSLNGMPMDNENYYYLYYIVRVKNAGNQPATITITDTPKYYDQKLDEVVEGGEIVKIVKWTWTKAAPTAPVGEYPSGTNVTFTSGPNGSATWTTTYDAVTACKTASFGSSLYDQVQKAKAEQDFFVVIRYTKDTYNPVSGNYPNYHNSVTANLEVNDPQKDGDVRPDPANGIEGNDFNDTHTRTANAYAEYIPHSGWGWGGGLWSVAKTIGSSGYGNGSGTTWVWGGSVASNYTVTMDGDGYNLTDIGRGYSMTVWDDDVYARPVYINDAGNYAYGAWTKLGAGDYELVEGFNIASPGPRVQITAWQADRETGVHVMDTSKLPEGSFKLYGEKADGTWEQITSFTMTASNSTISSTSEGDQAVRYVKLTSSMFSGKGYIGFKVESPKGLVDHVEIKIIGIRVKLLGTSPKMESWRQQYGDKLKNAHVLNFATYRFYQEGATGDYFWSNPQSGPTAEYSGATTGLAESEKTEDGDYELYKSVYTPLAMVDWAAIAYKSVLNEVNDTTARMYRYQWRISGMQYLNVQGSPSAALREFMADNGVFYDLLPAGYSIDLTRPITAMGYSGNQNGGSNSLYAVLERDPIVIDNYKNTGRQLVIFQVKTLKAHGYNYNLGAQQTMTGFCVDFWTQVAYADITNKTVTNIVSYQRGDRKNFGFGYSNARGYGKYQADFKVNNIFPLANVELEVFDTASTGNTTAYQSKGVLPTFLPSIQAGLYKAVKATLGVWTTNDVTDVDANYSYRLRLQTSGEESIKYYTGDIVLYDTLENAANTGGATNEIDGWKGTLVSVDTSAVVSLGAAPVVYYTTKTGISYNNGFSEAWEDSLANNPGIWVRADEYTGDLAAVTAIAIDMRYEADGTTPFVVEDEKNLDIIVNMHAPGAVPESQYAYNRPAFQATTWTENAPQSPVLNFEIGSRTVLALRDLQDIKFVKYYDMFSSSAGTSVQNPLAGATFALYKCIDPNGDYLNVGMPGTEAAASCWDTTPVSTVISNGCGEVSFNKLDSGIYAIRETAVPGVPVGIQRLTYRFWYFEVDAVAGTITTPVCQTTANNVSPVEFTTGENNMLMLEDPIYTVNVSVEKIWKDGGNADDDRPESIRVQLMRNGENYGPVVTLNADNNWSYTWSNLQKYSAYTSASNNKPYSYTVVEADTPAGYISTTAGTMANGFKITNTRVVELSGIKEWDHNINPEEDRPTSAEILLKRNGTQIDSVMATEETGWAWSFTNLPKYDDNGDAYTYEVDETAIPDYDTTIVQNPDGTYTVTNVYAPSGDLKVTKTVATASPGSPNQTFNFIVTVTKENTAVTGTYETVLSTAGSTEDVPGTIVFDEEGKATFTLQGGQSLLIKALPKNASYTVEETLPTGWSVSYEGETGTIAAGSVTEAVFTNTYNASGSTAIEGEKTLNGRALKAGEFEFALYAVDAQTGEETMIGQPVSNDADGKFSFPPISYGLSDHGKTYTYVVRELRPVIAVENGITYTTDYFTVEVAVSDNGSGTMNAVQTIKKNGQEAADTIEFVNTYLAKPVTIRLSGTKSFTGYPEGITPPVFEFTLSENGEVIRTARTQGAGDYTFGEITYDTVGEHTYTVKELKPVTTVENGITYGLHTYTVVVNVTDPGNGQLAATITVDGAASDGSGLDYTNSYKAKSVDVQFSGLKTIEGTRPLGVGDFTFNLYEGTDMSGTPLQTKTNAADGSFTFDKITYDETGTHVYTVKEAVGSIAGIVYDAKVYTISVEVTDPGNGRLAASITGINANGSGLNFNNPYETVDVDGIKTWDDDFDRDGIRPESITVTLMREVLATERGRSAEVVGSKVVTEEDGWSYSWTGLPKYEPGSTTANKDQHEYNYYVVETDIDWDENVTDHGYTAHYNGMNIENEHEPELIDIPVEKIWDDYENRYNTRPESITVHLLADGEVLRTAVLSDKVYELAKAKAVDLGEADGWYHVFEDLYKYRDGGTPIVYTVTEDPVQFYTTTITGSPEDGFVITNRYRKSNPPEPPVEPEGSISFHATKVLEGMDLEAGMFRFELYEGGTKLQSKTNAANGAVSFDAIHYTKVDVGTHTYTIKEAAGSMDGMTYDGTVYTITVTVADDGSAVLAVTADGAEGIVFTNTYEGGYEEEEDPNDPNNPHAPYEDEADEEEPETPHSPYTGDDRHTAYWLLLSFLSLGGMAVLGRKRREEK